MKKLLYILLLSLTGINAIAQENNISLQFKKILFRDLADTLERTVPVKIYYSNKWVDSLFLDINSKNEPINALLENSIVKNGLSFIITELSFQEDIT